MGHWVWRSHYWGFVIQYEDLDVEAFKCGFEAADVGSKYGFEAVDVESKYGFATKCKYDGLTIVIFWKVMIFL